MLFVFYIRDVINERNISIKFKVICEFSCDGKDLIFDGKF